MKLENDIEELKTGHKKELDSLKEYFHDRLRDIDLGQENQRIHSVLLG